MVNAFVAAAEEDQAGLGLRIFARKNRAFARVFKQVFREFFYNALSENFAVRCEENDRAGVEFADVEDGIVYRLCRHQHAGSAAKRFVVDFFVLIEGEFSDVVNVDVYYALFARALNDAFVEIRVEDLRKDCENVEAHSPSIY